MSVWRWGVFQCVALSDEALNFCCEVWFVFLPIASGDVFLVCVLDDCIEYGIVVK